MHVSVFSKRQIESSRPRCKPSFPPLDYDSVTSVKMYGYFIGSRPHVFSALFFSPSALTLVKRTKEAKFHSFSRSLRAAIFQLHRGNSHMAFVLD